MSSPLPNQGPETPARKGPLSLWRVLPAPAKVRCTATGLAGEIVREVAAAYRMTPEEIMGPGLVRRIAHARQAAMARLMETGRFSTIEVGRFLGGRDHSTVMTGVRRHRERMERQ